MAVVSTLAPARRTQASRQVALATEIRHARADQRRRFCQLGAKGACRVAAAIVSHPAPWARGWKVMRLLIAIPGIGHYRAHRAMLACHITENRVIGALDDRQRHDLCLWLENRAAAWRGSAS